MRQVSRREAGTDAPLPLFVRYYQCRPDTGFGYKKALLREGNWDDCWLSIQLVEFLV